MRRHVLIATLGALLAGTPATARNFTPPEGCSTYLTVQSKGCSVSVLWRCEAAPGSHWEASFGPDGLQAVVSYDADYQWLDALYLWDSSREELIRPMVDPISIDELIETDIDTYDFTMRRTEPGLTQTVRMLGADQFTGERRVIDGHDLDLVATELRILGEAGDVQYHARGVQYLSRELRQFFLGPDQVFDPDGAVTDYDGSPVDIIHPGEPGFGATTPLYECNRQDA